MKGIHPHSMSAAAVAALAASLAAGCQNPAGGVGNPFLAPHRVPPPATRALLPGEAQPYYPGDPLPVMQSQNGGAREGGTVLAAAGTPQMPSADEHLQWTSPSGESQPAASTTTPSIASAAAPATPSEPTVAIPSDGDTLRFALPTPPEPQPFVPPATPPLPLQPASQMATAAPTHPVAPAAYAEPMIGNGEATPSPWRSPQLAPTPPARFAPQAVVQAPAAQPLGAPPAAVQAPAAVPPGAPPVAAPSPALWPQSAAPVLAANTMDVRLRATPSPPLETYSPAPRIRIPGGYESAPYIGSKDGFRPRSSMR